MHMSIFLRICWNFHILSKPAKPPKQGTPEPGCQTSPKECIKIGKNREESELLQDSRMTILDMIYIFFFLVCIYIYIHIFFCDCMRIYIYNIYIYRASTARMTKLEMFSDVHVEWSVWGYQDIDNQLLLWVGPIWMGNQRISTVFLHPLCSNFTIHPDSSLVLGCIRVFPWKISRMVSLPGWCKVVQTWVKQPGFRCSSFV